MYDDHRDLHSFPTRRSSDLAASSIRVGLGGPSLAAAAAFAVSTWRACSSSTRLCTSNGTMVAVECGIWLTAPAILRSEEHTSELQSHVNLVCRLLLEKKK